MSLLTKNTLNDNRQVIAALRERPWAREGPSPGCAQGLGLDALPTRDPLDEHSQQTFLQLLDIDPVIVACSTSYSNSSCSEAVSGCSGGRTSAAWAYRRSLLKRLVAEVEQRARELADDRMASEAAPAAAARAGVGGGAGASGADGLFGSTQSSASVGSGGGGGGGVGGGEGEGNGDGDGDAVSLSLADEVAEAYAEALMAEALPPARGEQVGRWGRRGAGNARGKLFVMCVAVGWFTACCVGPGKAVLKHAVLCRWTLRWPCTATCLACLARSGALLADPATCRRCHVPRATRRRVRLQQGPGAGQGWLLKTFAYGPVQGLVQGQEQQQGTSQATEQTPPTREGISGGGNSRSGCGAALPPPLPPHVSRRHAVRLEAALRGTAMAAGAAEAIPAGIDTCHGGTGAVEAAGGQVQFAGDEAVHGVVDGEEGGGAGGEAACGLVTLRVSPNMLAGSTGCHEWEAGFALAELVLSRPQLFKGLSGAGEGVIPCVTIKAQVAGAGGERVPRGANTSLPLLLLRCVAQYWQVPVCLRVNQRPAYMPFHYPYHPMCVCCITTHGTEVHCLFAAMDLPPGAGPTPPLYPAPAAPHTVPPVRCMWPHSPLQAGVCWSWGAARAWWAWRCTAWGRSWRR